MRGARVQWRSMVRGSPSHIARKSGSDIQVTLGTNDQKVRHRSPWRVGRRQLRRDNHTHQEDKKEEEEVVAVAVAVAVDSWRVVVGVAS